MNNSKDTRRAIVHLLLISSVAHAADHRNGYHWARTSLSFTLGVIDSISNTGINDWENTWDTALDGWSRSNSFDLATIPGENDQVTRNDCPAKAGFIRVCNDDYGQQSWTGKAEWSYTYGDAGHDHMISCTVKLNDNKLRNTLEKDKLLCHEIGHCLGLDHTSETGQSDGTCMDYSYGASESRGPSDEDIEILEDVYGHVDASNSFEFIEPAPIDELDPIPIVYKPDPVVDEPDPVVDEPDLIVHEDNQCSAYDKKKKKWCKIDPQCTWDKNTKSCYTARARLRLPRDVIAPAGIQEDADCSNFTENSCKQEKACKWKKNECIDNNRRLEEECDYDPVDFEVPPKTNVVACDFGSVTFELIEGNVATRYHVVLTKEARRLRGSS